MEYPREPEQLNGDDALNEQMRRYRTTAEIRRMGRISSNRSRQDIIRTGITQIDNALIYGGLPRSGITEIAGTPASGKTALALQIAREVIEGGGVCAFLDIENSTDRSFIKKSGIKSDRFLLSSPDTPQQCIETAELLISSNTTDLIIIDSVAAFLTDDAILPSDPQSLPEFMTRCLRKLKTALKHSRSALILINQLQQRNYTDGSSVNVSLGGNALKLHSGTRLSLGPAMAMGSHRKGLNIPIEIIKGYADNQNRKTQFSIDFNKGIILG